MSDANGVTGIAHLFEQDDELVAADPGQGCKAGALNAHFVRARHRILTSNTSPETLCEFVDQGIAGLVPQTIVNQFEVVEIEEENRRITFGMAPLALDHHLQAVHEDSTVGQSRQWIMRRFKGQG